MLQFLISITSLTSNTSQSPSIHPHFPNPVKFRKNQNAKMQFIILAFAALVAATPARLRAKRAPSDVCPAIDTPLCCQADVDGVLALTCSPREYRAIPKLDYSTNLTTFSNRRGDDCRWTREELRRDWSLRFLLYRSTCKYSRDSRSSHNYGDS